MTRLFAILILCTVHNAAYAQSDGVTKESLLSASQSLAIEMGKTYQLAKNCKQDMENISALRTRTLFEGYHNNDEVGAIMREFKKGMANKKVSSCDLEAIRFSNLMFKLSGYMRRAAPFARKDQ